MPAPLLSPGACGNGRSEHVMRIKVQLVLSSDVRFFQDWTVVLTFVMSVKENQVDDDA